MNKCLETTGCGGGTVIEWPVGSPLQYEIRKGPDLKTSGIGADSYTYSYPGMVYTRNKIRTCITAHNLEVSISDYPKPF